MSSNPVQQAIAEWAAATPKVRRVWMVGDTVALEIQPVPDSEETFAVWMANCDKWHAQLQARTGRTMELEWFDPDVEAAPSEAGVLVYERAI